MKKKKKRRLRKSIIYILSIFIVVLIGVLGFLIYRNYKDNICSTYYLALDRENIELSNQDGEKIFFIRGNEVQVKSKRVVEEDKEYGQIVYNDDIYLIPVENLVEDRKDCVLEKQIYALKDNVLLRSYDDYHIAGNVKQEELLNIDSYHELLSDGSVDYYYVNNTGYISSNNVSYECVDISYDSSVYRNVETYDGGDPSLIHYYPKSDFTPKTQMPDIVKALYINAEAVDGIDSYIDIAKQTTGINAFVVDIKDCYVDTQLAYDSNVAKQYAPSTSNIPNSFDTYKTELKKLKDEGYYLIGRITAFKDDAFAVDNPDEALLYNGSLYQYGFVKWPSIYSRKMWEYNVALALEAVEEMGFDEIQFDYVRLPEDVEDVDLRNIYNESRIEAIAGFLRYAVDILHSKGIYVSADVFGETSGYYSSEFSCFVTDYGQFWPMISNIVDAISSMPYPDHFSAYSYGIEEPWAYPGELMYEWGKATYHAQNNTYDAAKCRTWIMAQNSDPYDIVYDVDMIRSQIDGLKAANVFDGYLTWNAASSRSKYSQYISAFD